MTNKKKKEFIVTWEETPGVFVDAATIYHALRAKYPGVNFQVKMKKPITAFFPEDD